MSTRPLKKRRLCNNPFIDLEADVDDDEDNESDLPDIEDELDEEEELWDYQRAHERLCTEDSDSMDKQWESFIARAQQCSRNPAAISSLLTQSGIWEIACKNRWARQSYSSTGLTQMLGHITNPHTTMFRPSSWACVRGVASKWRAYRGDVGMIKQIGELIGVIHLVLLLLLRLPLEPVNEWSILPKQKPASISGLRAAFGNKSVSVNEDGSFNFKCRFYTIEGYLSISLSDIDIMVGDMCIPSTSEFGFFVESGLVDVALNATTHAAFLSFGLSVGAHVRIIGGDFHGLVGHVYDVMENEYIIGLVGWVINCSMGHGDKQVTVVNQSTDSETIVLESQLDFHDGDFIMSTLRVHRPGCNVKLGERDPNEVYIGKRIIVHVDTSSLQPPSTPFVTTVCPDSTSPAWDPSSRTLGP
ncbi:hypothetical protein CPB84DRAFT_1753491 [Gymnopilus junonius]|uniref:Uncharacterized protein n=1 Tax=Gymnopilus junonius TaxID=109634 RepID=A0A9P5TF31_GYMJU|nr:hypothetical protein CPB84DRAFT_1753491 [Gymnopilus junonius]